MSNQTFKKGDNVFHAAYGWGKVMGITNDYNKKLPIEVEFLNWDCELFTEEGRTAPGMPLVLSFTEYTFEGFSLERPEDLPQKGDIVWVRDDKDDRYDIYHFMKHIPNNEFPYMVSQDFDEDNIASFRFITTKNPYTYEK
jgi:hypothetical protein